MQFFIYYMSTPYFSHHLQGQCVFRWCLIHENARNGKLQILTYKKNVRGTGVCASYT